MSETVSEKMVRPCRACGTQAVLGGGVPQIEGRVAPGYRRAIIRSMPAKTKTEPHPIIVPLTEAEHAALAKTAKVEGRSVRAQARRLIVAALGLACLVLAGCSGESTGPLTGGENGDAGAIYQDAGSVSDGAVCTVNCVRFCGQFCGVGSPDAYVTCGPSTDTYSTGYCAAHCDGSARCEVQ